MDRYQLLEKFENGRDRCLNDPLFHTCINAILNGVDVYKIIDHLINMNSELQNAGLERLRTSTIPHTFFVIPEEK